jgi:putative transposase
MVRIDRNLDNVTTADTDWNIRRYGSLAKATLIKKKIRQIKRKFLRNDARIRKRVFGKCGKLQRDRVGHILNNVWSRIVKVAKLNELAIVMEDITGIRKMYQKGNGQGKSYRARLNSWSYYELQRQIEYKARWEGLSVKYLPARGTSVKCSMCGSRTYPKGHRRTLYCPECRISCDRDQNAARNILAKGCGGGLGTTAAIPIPYLVRA